MADSPNNGGKKKRQQKTEQRAGNGYDNFVERGNSRKPRAVHIGLSLDNVHGSKLRQRHKAPEWQRAERILDAVDGFFPERFAEPDPEFFYVKSPPARSQKMPEFMHYDEQIKKDEDLQQDQNNAGDLQNHGD